MVGANKMVEIIEKKGKKSKVDKVTYVNGKKVSYADVSEQIIRLVKKHGEKKVRKELDIPKGNHRPVNKIEWSLTTTKKVVKNLYANENRLYPKNKGKMGDKYTKNKFSRDIHRHITKKPKPKKRKT